ncbi:hypothetical protein [Aliirhizobium smilacinae]|uniref:hypothetical protein n=1 Tax=Aliirhizobium smilacinae TaxID=1395944 RepID=UPI0015D5BF5C|nr:hypothetical protein [Rhizobium smilacinae]
MALTPYEWQRGDLEAGLLLLNDQRDFQAAWMFWTFFRQAWTVPWWFKGAQQPVFDTVD